LYDFKQLSPADFEDLSRDLLQKHWDIRLESFKTGKDKGIDLRYAQLRKCAWIIQCKHYVGSTVAKLISDLATKELPKINLLAPKRYLLVTSLPLNPQDKEKIATALDPHIQKPEDIVGAEDLNNLLGLFPLVEQQHFKLWLSSTAVLDLSTPVENSPVLVG
jgi:hypothetical protein